MSKIVDLTAYREKRRQEEEALLRSHQRAEYDRAVRQSQQFKPSPSWGIFVTTYQLLIKPRKEDQ